MFGLRATLAKAARTVSVSSSAATAETMNYSAQAVKAAPQASNAASSAGFTSSRMGFTSKFTPAGAVRYAHTDTAEPDFEAYRHTGSDSRQSYHKNRSFTYLMSGAGAVVGATASKNVVTGLIQSMSASADVLALAKVEVDLTKIPEGTSFAVMWRGKPLFIRHRTDEEIAEANTVDVSTLRDPETDDERAENPKFLIMIGVCTHLGCIPVGEAGEFGGWFCPCHGSHYDISGRIRKGPAPLNLEIPPYQFVEEGTRAIVG